MTDLLQATGSSSTVADHGATGPRTVAAALDGATTMLAGHSDSPRLDAEILLGKVLGLTRAALRVRGENTLAAIVEQDYAALIAQRRLGAPVAYLTGVREFWSLELLVTPAVLVPRPETELLVELALALLPQDAAHTVLDLGTGSGAIALALASERPGVRITGVDVSAEALAVAGANARRLGLTHVEWRAGSWFAAVPGCRFDLIVANPPYVAGDDPALSRLACEPALALTPGPTGLEDLERIVDGAAARLQPGGWLLLEHGSTQAYAVAGMLRHRGFAGIRSKTDHAGRFRVTLGTIHSS